MKLCFLLGTIIFPPCQYHRFNKIANVLEHENFNCEFIWHFNVTCCSAERRYLVQSINYFVSTGITQNHVLRSRHKHIDKASIFTCSLQHIWQSFLLRVYSGELQSTNRNGLASLSGVDNIPRDPIRSPGPTVICFLAQMPEGWLQPVRGDFPPLFPESLLNVPKSTLYTDLED
jgi:hypothetical protein